VTVTSRGRLRSVRVAPVRVVRALAVRVRTQA
jgi:hypothetical protein